MLELKPILSALWRHKISALLIAVQLALTLAIVSNSMVIIQDRLQKIARPTGMSVEDIVTVSFQPIPQDYDMAIAVQLDLDMIRSLPGVVGASHISQLPLSSSGSSTGFHREPNQHIGATDAGLYTGDEHMIDTLGMELTAGRSFTASDMGVMSWTSSRRSETAIVTQKFADELFPEQEALGKYIYYSGENTPVEIVGIVERNLGSWVNWSNAGQVVFFPALLEGGLFMNYLIRAETGQRDTVMKLVEEKLAERDPQRVIEAKTLEEYKDRSYANDNTMVKVISTVVTLLTFVVALGIVGLTVFWITQRRKQIGVRRALGATRSAISRYFLLENLLIATTGILLGTAAAQIFNHFLTSEFEQPALPLSAILTCALILLGVSLTAALVPALRAANISPATATRSV